MEVELGGIVDLLAVTSRIATDWHALIVILTGPFRILPVLGIVLHLITAVTERLPPASKLC